MPTALYPDVASGEQLSFTFERWLPVVGWEGFYEVSDLGRVRSLPRPVVRFGTPGVLPAAIKAQSLVGSSSKYLAVGLKNKGLTNRYVHHLVLEAFVGPRPEGMHACHNDGNRFNNRASNLRWDTPKGNMADKIAHGTHNRGVKQWRARLTEQEVRDIRASVAAGETKAAVARRYGVHFMTIQGIIKGRNWAWLE